MERMGHSWRGWDIYGEDGAFLRRMGASRVSIGEDCLYNGPEPRKVFVHSGEYSALLILHSKFP